MPGPFPGMDPWLEAPSVWRGCHDSLVVKTMELLQPALKKRGYYIELGERVWIAESERYIWPDEVILHRSHQPESNGGVATLVADDPVCVDRVDEEVREIFAEIHTAGSHELVTCLEFLSHTNKQAGPGKDNYHQKQRELKEAGVHLVEVDLLRGGEHALAVPASVAAQFKPWNYLVNLVRRDCREYQFYPVLLRNRLPRLRIPLKSGEEDAVLDLQAVLDRVYEIGPYPERLAYETDPTPPLAEEEARWADEILRQKGLRSERS
jgi:hypothetical protein